MDDVKWLALAIFLLACLVAYLWFLLDKVSSELSEYKNKIDKRLDYTEEKCGDYKLDIEKGFILVRDRILELEKEISELNTKCGQVNEALKGIGDGSHIVLNRLDKLEKEISGKMIGDGGSYTLGVGARLDKLGQDRDELFVTSKRSSNRLDKLEAIDIKILEKNFGDFKLHAETIFKNLWRKVHVSGDLEGIFIHRLDKLEGVKAPGKKTKKTKRKKS